ncbi:hypothetical protein ACFL6R_00970 [Gemmatimonadota bacterium]
MSEQPGLGEDSKQPTMIRSEMLADDISLFRLINVILLNRQLITRLSLFVLIIIIGYTLSIKRTYSAFTSFLPQAGANQRSISSDLAAQFGVSLPATNTGQTPAFYANLIESREILQHLADDTYIHSTGIEQVQTSLSNLFEIRSASDEYIRENVIQVLKRLISVNTNLETGLVTLTVSTNWPEISQEIVTKTINLVNQFNLETRQSQATAERQFVEERLQEAGSELRDSEDALQLFLQRNRQWQNSPELEFVHDRLQRIVVMRQQIFTLLNQAMEQARIDAVRDTPVITIVEKAVIPIFPDRRNLLTKGILAIALGCMIGIFAAFWREFKKRGHILETDEFSEYELLVNATINDILHPWRLLISSTKNNN